jgi:hypothetical protein
MPRVLLLLALFLFTLAPANAQGRTAQEVVDGFIAAGFPISEVAVYNEDTDRLFGRPGQYIEKVSWWDTRTRRGDEITIDSGGSLERFATLRDYRERLAYLEAVATGPLLGEYRYPSESELMILRIALALTPTAANSYGAAFTGG